jgi:transporter family-2 protein
LAVALSATAGLAGAVQVAVMGRFGERIGAFEAFAFSTFVTAAIAFASLLVVSRSAAGYAAALREPPWLWSAGLMGAFIVLTITVASPRIGTTATIGLLIAGQLSMGAVIDRFGLFGFEQIDLSWPRVMGIALLAVGAALSLHR